jgi:hypothetical protein
LGAIHENTYPNWLISLKKIKYLLKIYYLN